MFPLQGATGVPPRVQVLVAHPDDETFGCGSVLLHAAAAGATTSVVCATRGEAGQLREGTSLPRGGLGALREQELRDAARLLGVSEVAVLGLRDSDMSGTPSGDSLVGADRTLVRTGLELAVDAFGPDVLVTLDGGDGHRDHLRMRDLTLEVGRARQIPVYLSCLPRSVMRRWLAHTQDVHPDSPYLEGGDLGTPDEDITVVLDTTEHYDARWRAIRTHASQASPFEGLPDDLQRAFLCADHLIEVRPPVRGRRTA